MSRVFFGILIILFGLSFLFKFPFFNVLLAIVVIGLGIKVLGGRGSGFDMGRRGETNEDFLKRVLIFSGINRKVVSDTFGGAEVVAIFGGGDIDLSEVKTEGKTLNLDLVAIFGGLKVRVPESWDVESEGMGFLGGFENNTSSPAKESVAVRVKGVAIFGGVEVVN